MRFCKLLGGSGERSPPGSAPQARKFLGPKAILADFQRILRSEPPISPRRHTHISRAYTAKRARPRNYGKRPLLNIWHSKPLCALRQARAPPAGCGGARVDVRVPTRVGGALGGHAGSTGGRHAPAAPEAGLVRSRPCSGADRDVGQRACRAACPPVDARRGATCRPRRSWRTARCAEQVWIRFGQGGWTGSCTGRRTGSRGGWVVVGPMEQAARGERLEARRRTHLAGNTRRPWIEQPAR